MPGFPPPPALPLSLSLSQSLSLSLSLALDRRSLCDCHAVCHRSHTAFRGRDPIARRGGRVPLWAASCTTISVPVAR
ncbi:hypothetical protein LX32DRAFT_646153 [Colletotrichum zoysiae]|uniref:Uncharacterized protein n=1 Tax=Colletotrichum zoysiae TaxID=1216348 RepID=A0AAD9LXF9_9PEZI|nr:hypothetical protein LX32DRAFT_646153 [Colletotrichum zoysiae]